MESLSNHLRSLIGGWKKLCSEEASREEASGPSEATRDTSRVALPL